MADCEIRLYVTASFGLGHLDAEPVGRAVKVVTSTNAIDPGRLDAVGPEDD